MKLHVNLILETEKRSGSTISRKFLIRLLVGMGAALLLLLFGWFLYSVYAVRAERITLEQEKKAVDPAMATIQAMMADMSNTVSMAESMLLWRDSRLDWYQVLRDIQRVVPPTMQLTRLTSGETLTPVDNIPSRSVTMFLSGKAAGKEADDDVQRLNRDLMQSGCFTNVMAASDVKRFAATDATSGNRGMRVFDIECHFRVQPLAKPAAPPRRGR